ncbi:MAG: hypothetical protein CMJ81_02540 [Planctomycetaceae bacterium]|nr:hypothetical protein [Planctomycetaceae bacterium]MBP61602.1 hypothetical protein [Planctomycetaceae bacterium]
MVKVTPSTGPRTLFCCFRTGYFNRGWVAQKVARIFEGELSCQAFVPAQDRTSQHWIAGGAMVNATQKRSEKRAFAEVFKLR